MHTTAYFPLSYQNFCQVCHTLRLLCIYFYEVKLCKVTPFTKHNAITFAYFNLQISNMAYPWAYRLK